MKKVLCAILALVMIFSLCACGKKTSAADVEDSTPGVVGTLPIPFDDPATLAEAMTPVAFEAGDLKAAEDGTTTLDVDVYVQVTYDAVDVGTMKEGDRFFDADGAEMQVESVNFKDSVVEVNGGIDGGGVTLVSVGGGVYMQVTAEGRVVTFNCGAATYPVNAECTLLDNADPENQNVVVSLAELSDYLVNDTIGFNPDNTTMVIENSEVTQIIRNYLP